MNLKQYKSYFTSPAGIYALSHSVGPLPKVASLAFQDHFIAPWEKLGGDAWPSWLASIEGFCDSVATLLNVNTSEICPQPNLASGFSAYLTAIAKLPENSQKRVVLMHTDAFASMGFVVTALAESYELKLVLVDTASNDVNNTQAWADALQSHEVLACLFTHVHSNTSEKSDVSSLAKLAQSHQAYALVDIAQSVGVVPIDAKVWRADAIFGSCVKWLCGGPGAGYMYVPEAQISRLNPDPVGWFSHENPFEFDINNYAAANTAKRFWGGTPSVAAYVCAQASIDMMLDIGIENVAAHNLLLKQHLLQCLPQQVTNKPRLSELNNQGGSLCIGSDNMEATANKLNEKKVRFDRRGDIFRLSLHIMNSLEDAETIAACFDC